MKLHRIWGVILRFLFHFRHSLDRLIDVFYWPTLDLFLWGLTSLYFASLSTEASSATRVIVTGILLWLMVYRGQYEVSGNLLEDLWNKNFVNLFVSPLKFSEWVSSFIILGVVKSFLSFTFAIGLAYLLYQVKIFFFGFYLVPFIILLIMTGWWMGFLVAGIILRFGTRVQAFAWTLVWVISPFAALYYPVRVLPEWAQIISKLIPASYVFEGARNLIATGEVDMAKLTISFALNIVYFVLALIFLKKSFDAVLTKRGLVKVY